MSRDVNIIKWCCRRKVVICTINKLHVLYGWPVGNWASVCIRCVSNCKFSCPRNECHVAFCRQTAYMRTGVVMCEYSKFRIESNSYLLFDSIRNWRNYSKFSNTYLTVISRAIDTWFVCTLPATSRCTHLTLNPVLRRVCSYTSHSPDHTCTLSRACCQRQVSTVASEWLRYNGVRQTQRMVSWALALLSVFLWIQL